MPGLQKGKKHKAGAGRPSLGDQATRPVTVWLWPDQVAWLDQTPGGRSVTVRELVAWAIRQDGSAPDLPVP